MLCDEVLVGQGMDRQGLFAVASQGQDSPKICQPAAVMEWGKLEGEALHL